MILQGNGLLVGFSDSLKLWHINRTQHQSDHQCCHRSLGGKSASNHFRFFLCKGPIPKYSFNRIVCSSLHRIWSEVAAHRENSKGDHLFSFLGGGISYVTNNRFFYSIIFAQSQIQCWYTNFTEYLPQILTYKRTHLIFAFLTRIFFSSSLLTAITCF